jgi:hypothetical protein
MRIERHETGPRMSKAVIHGDTKPPARKPTNSAPFARHREISVCKGLRGGAERTRTSNQAVMSRHRGLGGLELPTKRLSAASSGY